MSANSFEDAREQACQKLGYMRSVVIETGTRKWEIPNPSLLDHEQQKRYNALRLYIQESPVLARYKDSTDDAGNVIKGTVKLPWRDTEGNLIEEDYDYRMAHVIFGDDVQAFITDGGRPSDIALIWAQMNEHTADRAKIDSKSDDRTEPVAAVPSAN